jgi:alpha-2-macroglobulin
MKKITLFIMIAAILIAAGAGYAIYHFVSLPGKVSPSSDFISYVSAYTSGSISTRDPIKVVFTSDIADAGQVGKDADPRFFQIKPSIKGTLTWYNERTLEFRPAKHLSEDTEYKVTLLLDRVFQDIPREFREFSFTLRTIRQAIETRVEGIEFYDDFSREDRRIKGFIHTADYTDVSLIQETVKAEQNGSKLELSWVVQEDERTHIFLVEGVTQSEEPGIVNLFIRGEPIGVRFSETIPVEVPVKGEFRVLSHKVTQSPSQSLEVRFSEPLDPSQNLTGLIRAAGVVDPQIVIEGNIVRVFPSTVMTGSYNFEVSDGIRSNRRKRLAQSTSLAVTFETLKPQVRLVGQGVIIPTSGEILFPFQAVSLKAVDVSITRIFEHNVAQFLQVNDLSGQSELRRVGRMVRRKTIMLDQVGKVDYNAWNTYYIDLTELISREPGAVYQVNVNFRKEYSTYNCGDAAEEIAIVPVDERYNAGDDTPLLLR